ncbi:MAG TPA: tRNA (adenosine(37)-N6)-dimethylallyltransferase MiaA [Candidatus Limisoma gallistercoris]|nr:tRNA (adenosine(37)-N6)-dimethylallyltransferase MiaA [Candidatus Limisoma gallistercoris]
MPEPCGTLIVVTGPTGVGKTDIAIRLAREFGTEIISADSRQIYRDIPIGTAAPTPEQLAEVKHHFVGILGLDEYYSAAQFEEDVMNLLPGLFARSPYVVMCGGSMMYVDAVCKGIDNIPTISDGIRTAVAKRLADLGADAMREELKRLDPEYYAQVDLNNMKRVVHAVEICEQAGVPYSHLRTGVAKQRPFRIVKIGLTLPRAELFDRINRRVVKMIDSGLVEEARKVYPMRHLNSLNTVGYKELFAWMDGTMDYDTAVARIQKNTRVYAKKQLTWYAKDPSVQWFLPTDYDKILSYCRHSTI